MRKAVLMTLLLLVPAATLLAQPWRDNRYTPRDNSFDVTPFAGYRWGGTIYADQTNLYGQNVDLQSSANYGVSFGIPISQTGLKLELMVDRQDTNVGTGGGLFTPGGNFGNFHVTYYHGGLMIPFNQSRAATPYVAVSAGLANLDPAKQGVTSTNKFSAAAGVGVNVPINRQLGFRVEFRGFYTPTGNTNNCSHCSFNSTDSHGLVQGETKLGLSVKF
jgi:Outer membrane protein beta-barrel domain